MSNVILVLLIMLSLSIIAYEPSSFGNEMLLKSSICSSDFAIAFIGFGIALLVRGGKK